MIRSHGIVAWVIALTWLSLPVLAADVAPTSREQLEQAKAAVELRYKRAQADCAGRFQVTDCLSQARADRREALAPLQRQQLQWDDAKRRERAQERRQVLQKRAAEAAKAASAPGTARTTKTRKGAPSEAASAPLAAPPAQAAWAPANAPQAAASGVKAQLAADKAREHRQQAQERQQKQQAHQQALDERNARQDSKHPPKAGLPVPGSVVR